MTSTYTKPQLEKELESARASAALYQSLFEHMLDGYAYCKMILEPGAPPDFLYLTVNPAFEALTGLKDVVGRRVSQVIPGVQTTNPELFEVYGRVAETGKPERFETYLPALEIWFAISVFQPQADHFVAVFDNISERKKAEAVARASQARFQALVENSGDAFAMLSGEGVILYESPSTVRQIGFEPDELVGRAGLPMVHPVSRREASAIWQAALGSPGKPQTAELRYETHDGSERWVEVTFTNHLDNVHIAAIVANYRDITERRQAYQDLRRSQANLQALITAANESVFLIELDGTIVILNETAAARLRSTADDMRGRNFYDYLPPEIAAARREFASQVVVSGQPVSFEDERFGRWIENRIYPVRDEQGQVIRLAIYGRDFTERRQAEAALHDAEMNYRTLFENAPIGIFRAAPDGRLTSVNPMLATMHGYDSPASMLAEGVNLRDLWADTESGLAKLRAATMGDQVVGLSDEHRRRDGSPLWIQAAGRIVQADDGSIVYREGFMVDITARRQAELDLATERNRLKILINTIPDLIWLKDVDGKFLVVNPNFQRYMGRSEPELLGHTDFDFLEHSVAETYRNIDLDVLATGKPAWHDGEIRYADDNRPMHMETIKAAVFDGEGRLAGVLGISRDVTERWQMQEALRRSEEQFRTLFETMATGAIYQSADDRAVGANPAALRILGLDRDQLGGWKPYGLVYEAICEDGSPYPAESHPPLLALKTGRAVYGAVMGVYNPTLEAYRWIRVNSVPQFNTGEATPYQVYTTFEDVTEHKEAEAELRERLRLQAQLETIAGTVPGMIHTLKLSATGAFSMPYTSPAIVDIYGLQPSDVVADASLLFAQIDSRDAERVEESLRASAHSFAPWRAEYRLKHPVKGERWLEGHSVPHRESDDSIVWYGYIHDVTDRKNAETELRESEARFRSLIEQSSDGIALVDEHARVIEWNRANELITGIPRTAALGCRPFELSLRLAGDGSAEAATARERQAQLAAALSTGDFEAFKWPLEGTLMREGRLCHVRQTLFPIKTDAGYRAGMLVQDVTERKESEQALQRSEERFALSFMQNPVALSLVRLSDGCFAEINNAFTRLLGFTLDEAIGRSQTDLDIYVYTGAWEQALTLMKVQGNVHSLETRIRTKSGAIRFVQISLETLLLDEEPCVLTSLEDITERKQAETALRSSEERFVKAFQMNPIALTLTRIADGHILDINAAGVALMGYTRAEVVDHTTIELSLIKTTGSDNDTLELLAERAALKNSDHILRTKSGELRQVRISRETMDLNGETCVLSAIEDVTERNRAELAFQESERRYRAIFEGANESILIIDSVKRAVQFVNPAACKLFGYSAEELIGRSVDDLRPTDVLPEIAAQNSALDRGEVTALLAIPRRRKDGSLFYADISTVVMPVLGRDMVVRFVNDVTARRRSEALLQARLRLSNLAPDLSLDDVMRQTLDAAEDLTGSQIGFFHFVDADQNTLTLQSWSTNTLRNLCSAEGKGQHYSADLAGVWADALRNRRAVVINDYLARTDRKGLPAGHAAVNRLISVPVWRDGSIVAMIGVGNKAGNYDQYDVEMVGVLASETWDIVLRKRAEERERSGQARYRLLFENAPLGILLADPNGQILEVNPSALSTLGSPSAEATKQINLLAFPPLMEAGISADIRICLESGRQMLVERPYLTNWGKQLQMHLHLSPVLDGRGQVAQVQILIEDMSEQKRLEAEVRASAELYRSLVESLESNMAIVDADGVFHFLNDQAAASLGSTPEILRGQRMHDLFPAEVADFQMQGVRSVIASGQRRVDDAASIVAGRKRWFRTSVLPIRDTTGKVTRAIINALDITARKEAELLLEDLVRDRTAELEASRQRLELATRAADLGIWDLDVESGRVNWDAQVFTIYGVDSHVFDGRLESFLKIVHPEDRRSLIIFNPENMSTMSHQTVFFRVLRPSDGMVAYIKAYGVVLTNMEGKPVRVVGVIQDNTAEYEAEQALRASEETLREANSELARASRVKDEFLANMSHELRTPLNGILALSEAELEGVHGPLNDRQRKSVESIESSGRHLLALINDVLDVSKIEAGRLELVREWIDLDSICQASLVFVREPAVKKGLALRFQTDAPAIRLQADGRRIKQILTNLLGNAVKFTPVGGQVILRVQAEPSDRQVCLIVEDTGVGIAEENLKKLFMPFVQLDTSLTRQYEGTGLGLALVSRLAELHGGSVSVESELGKGSRFIVRLPWDHEASAAYTSRKGKTGALQYANEFGRALVIDDSAAFGEQLAGYLRQMAIETRALTAGQVTLPLPPDFRPDVVFLDVAGVDSPGWKLLTQLTQDESMHNMPIVLVSVFDMRERAQLAGAAGFLSKPFKVTQIEELLASLSMRAQPAKTAISPMFPRKAVLLVEDSEINIEAIFDYLQSHNFDVIVARNGQEALDAAQQHHIDMILMDIQMPVMDGLEAITRLRAMSDYVHVPVIALTALAMPGDRERCLAAGANDYISKPVALKVLLKKMQELMAI